MNKISDLTNVGIGYFAADPNGDILGSLGGVLLNVVPSSGAVDEILKMFAGVIVAVISKFLYGLIDRRAARRQQNQPGAIEPQPDELNLNDNNEDGSK